LVAIPAHIDYEFCFILRYALRCCQQAAESLASNPHYKPQPVSEGPLVVSELISDETAELADEEADVALPLIDSRADAEALLIATENVFVTLGAPGRLGTTVTTALLGAMGVQQEAAL
jgi:hypothetical protein